MAKDNTVKWIDSSIGSRRGAVTRYNQATGEDEDISSSELQTMKNRGAGPNLRKAEQAAKDYIAHKQVVDTINPDKQKPIPSGSDETYKESKYKNGGYIKSSVSSRGDGCATKGHTKGAMR